MSSDARAHRAAATRRAVSLHTSITPVLLALLWLALLPGSSPAADQGSGSNELTDLLDARIPRLMARYEVPGVAIATVHDGAITFSHVYGWADPADGRALDPTTLFRVESLSKPLAAATVLHLVDAGLVALDDTLSTHVADWPSTSAGERAETVTVRQLLGHRAGLQLGTIGSQYAPDEPRPTLRDHLGDEARIVQAPGEGFRYSNPGYDLLELLIEEVTGSDFATVASDAVLEPLGMTDASFVWTEDRARRLATGHDLAGAPVEPYVYASSASGGLIATVDDLARFAAALAAADHDPDTAQTVAVSGLLTPTGPLAGPYRAVGDRYGMGVFLETGPDGRSAAFAGGQGNGWMSHLHVVPDTGHGIVILTNSQRSWPLIAHVLTDWAEWTGAEPLGMQRIVTATRILWGAIAAMLAVACWQAWRVLRRMRPTDDRGAKSATRQRTTRAVQAAGGLAALATLGWAGQQDYLFVTSVFPAASPWLGVAIAAVGVALLISAVAPHRREHGG